MKQFCMKNRSYFPGERKCIVFALQHGGNDVNSGLVVRFLEHKFLCLFVCLGLILIGGSIIFYLYALFS